MFFQRSEPIPQLWLNRFFIGVIVVLALIAGYFYTENQKLLKLIEATRVQNTANLYK